MRAVLHDVVRHRMALGAAIPAITCYGASTAVSVVEAADAGDFPVILLVPPALATTNEGFRTIAAMRAIADAAAVPVSVQLDHASDRDLIETALRAGVDAVLADGSKLPATENAAFVRMIAELAGSKVTIEAELGSLAGNEDRATGVDPDAAGLTDPDEVVEFVDRSGCDLLAVAVGNVHGRYRGKPLINRQRLEQIRAISRVPLVMHGASGLPRSDLARAGASGIGKVNINTELRGVILDVLQAGLIPAREAGDDIATLSQASAAATRAFTTSISRLLTGNAND